MRQNCLASSIEQLSEVFSKRNWRYLDVPAGSPLEKTYAWPAGPDEEIMICVHKGARIQELFHRQDFFFFNFAYKGDYGAISYQYDNRITVHQGECYIGQPHAGYALSADGEKEIVIIGVLIRKDTFFRKFLPALSSNTKLFHFFLEPQTNRFSDEFIRLRFDEDAPVRGLLEMMVVEYAHQQPDTQDVLRPLVLALLMIVARQFTASNSTQPTQSLADKIVQYMGEHSDVVTLKDIAAQFSYHPNYISTLLHRELGKSFSQLLLEQRMERAVALLKGTNLPINEIAAMLGYSNSSNFYKAFRAQFHQSPRDHMESQS